MKNLVQNLIKDYINKQNLRKEIQTKWKEPLIGFADVHDCMFLKLKEIIGENHKLPTDFLKGGQTVISYFIPFDRPIPISNINGEDSSEAWALAYVETNTMMMELNNYMEEELRKYGYDSAGTPLSCNFDTEKLVNDWSHRHVAYIAGLGRFGLNNMLITDSGCCGRFGNIITSLKIEPSNRPHREFCLYKHSGGCKKCIERCVNGALRLDYFDRKKCYEMCLHNDEKYSYIGNSDVCGKCIVGVPCSFTNPCENLSRKDHVL